MNRIAWCILLCAMLEIPDARAQVAVIANASVTAHSIDANELLDIYSCVTNKWEDGSSMTVITLKKNEHVVPKFFTLLNKRPLDMYKLWMRLQLSGEAKPPLAMNSEEEVVTKVLTTPGAIGFVDQKNVPSGVKILMIIE